MTLLEYLNEFKDRLLLPRDVNDGFHTDVMLKKNIRDALRRVTTDAKLFQKSEQIALVADVYEYAWPVGCLKIHSLIHTYNNTTTPLLPIPSYTAFIDGFDPASNKAVQPTHWTAREKKAEVHRFWHSDESDYVTSSEVTSGDQTYLYDEYANFGVIESGEKIEPDDIAWNDPDDSWGTIDYPEMNTVVITGSSSVSGGSATTLTTADDLTNAKIGHLIWDTTANIWGWITAINTSTGIITVHEWNAEGDETIPSSGDSFKIGIANEIYFNPLNAFATRGVQGGADNTFAAGDTYRVQDKFYTVPSFKIKPTPSADDITGTESLEIVFSSEPQQMVEDDDPCCVEDQWSSYILDYAYLLALKRQPERLGEIASLEAAYKIKIRDMTLEQATFEYGTADNIYSHINPQKLTSTTSWRLQTA